MSCTIGFSSRYCTEIDKIEETVFSIQSRQIRLRSKREISRYNNRYAYGAQFYQDPIRKAIMTEKIKPKGEKSWMNLEEGVRRIRNESFAFHGGRSPIYQLMQETYQEEDKCGVTELDYLNMMYPLVPIQKQSPYFEILKVG